MNEIKKVYFIGIGGIGMSAIARYFNSRGVAVFGYDKTSTTLTRTLEAEGMTIHYDENVDAIPEGVNLVVYTPAVPQTHAELVYFREQGFDIKKRAEVLGMLSQNHQTIAVAGTHGKTTTTSILTHLLKVGGVDCTAFLGGIANNFSSNFVDGKSNWMVVEADEYDRSFLQLSPDLAVILSMDADHLDIYGNPDSVANGFREFGQRLKPNGQLWLNQKWVTDYFKNEKSAAGKEWKSYGLETGDIYSDSIHVKNGCFLFDYHADNQYIGGLEFALPGKHNVENATVAVAIALALGVKTTLIREGLATFKGIKRRFEIVFRNDRQVYIDDYAHHPSELIAAIEAARDLNPGKKITGIFQPHLYSRTRDFMEGFADVLSVLDEIILLDIYPARELPIEGISSKVIFDKIENKNKTLATKADVLSILKERNLEVLMTLGAGDIDTLVEPIKNAMTNGEI